MRKIATFEIANIGIIRYTQQMVSFFVTFSLFFFRGTHYFRLLANTQGILYTFCTPFEWYA